MKRECVTCGKPAYFYRLERDGTRIYLCEQHMLDYVHPEFEPHPPEGDSPEPRQGE